MEAVKLVTCLELNIWSRISNPWEFTRRRDHLTHSRHVLSDILVSRDETVNDPSRYDQHVIGLGSQLTWVRPIDKT